MHFINQNIFPSTMKKSIKVLVFHINICSAHSSFYFEVFFLLQLAPDWNNYKPLSTPGLAVQEGFSQMNRDFHRVADRGIFLIPEINGVPYQPPSPHNPYLFPNFLLNHSSYKQTLKNTHYFRQNPNPSQMPSQPVPGHKDTHSDGEFLSLSLSL